MSHWESQIAKMKNDEKMRINVLGITQFVSTDERLSGSNLIWSLHNRHTFFGQNDIYQSVDSGSILCGMWSIRFTLSSSEDTENALIGWTDDNTISCHD